MKTWDDVLLSIANDKDVLMISIALPLHQCLRETLDMLSSKRSLTADLQESEGNLS